MIVTLQDKIEKSKNVDNDIVGLREKHAKQQNTAEFVFLSSLLRSNFDTIITSLGLSAKIKYRSLRTISVSLIRGVPAVTILKKSDGKRSQNVRILKKSWRSMRNHEELRERGTTREKRREMKATFWLRWTRSRAG